MVAIPLSPVGDAQHFGRNHNKMIEDTRTAINSSPRLALTPILCEAGSYLSADAV
jgi:hypothetical protein